MKLQTFLYNNLQNCNLHLTSTSLLTSINIPTPTENSNIQPNFGRRYSSGKKTKNKSSTKKLENKSDQNTIKNPLKTNQNRTKINQDQTNNSQNHNSTKKKLNKPIHNLSAHFLDPGLKSASVPTTPCYFQKMDELREEDSKAEQITTKITTSKDESPQENKLETEKVSKSPKKSALIRRSESTRKQKVKPTQSGSNMSTESSPLYRRGLAARRASACLPAPLSLDQVSNPIQPQQPMATSKGASKNKNIKNLTLTTSNSNNNLKHSSSFNQREKLLSMKIDMNKLANLPPNSPKCRQPAYEQGEPAEVLPFLFLGSAFHAQQEHFLKKFGITAVINCQKKEVEGMSKNVKIITIPIEDNAIADIKSHFNSVIEFIDREHANGGKTLVHCRAGISRSATICLAYLIKTRGYAWEQAYNFVKERRSLINPNFNFMGQLQKFESECKEAKKSSEENEIELERMVTSPKSDRVMSPKIKPEDIMEISPMNSPRLSPKEPRFNPKESKLSLKEKTMSSHIENSSSLLAKNNTNSVNNSPKNIRPPQTAVIPTTAHPDKYPNFKKPFEISPKTNSNSKTPTTPLSFFTFSSSTTNNHSKNSSPRSATNCGNESPSPVQTPSPTAIIK